MSPLPTESPGETGVEFVHMFKSLSCEVTLVVSRQQVPPQKDP
jgi:dihydrolipoamide dehydrogenase